VKRLLVLALLLGLGAGVGYLVMTWSVKVHRDEAGRLAYVVLAPKEGPVALPAWPAAAEPTPDPEDALKALRIASFRLAGVDESRLADPRVGDVMARVVPQFQIVALQGLRGRPQRTLVRLVELVNRAQGPKYSFAVADPVNSAADARYCAFVFDQQAVEIDRSVLHLVADAEGRLSCAPLVGLFRARGPDPAEAFTFKLLCVDTAAEQAALELDLLDDVFRTERGDGLSEDDVILLGHLGTDERHLGRLGRLLDVDAAITSLPTTVHGGRRTDNILFDLRATTEFTGRAGVVDLMRELDLPAPQVAAITAHLPVWAEFSVFEGGAVAEIASGPLTERK